MCMSLSLNQNRPSPTPHLPASPPRPLGPAWLANIISPVWRDPQLPQPDSAFKPALRQATLAFENL